ncbi:MAG: endonuclease/exonuclease/phosphatase family protein [Verrucomicrobia bacterium]|nr:endonuclease/exonuclease/phosphatase family protein [Verrucomicrobiota bacterium]
MRAIPVILCMLATVICRGEDLRVLSWNVQEGANNFENGPEKALKVIKDSGANLVLMQESDDIAGDRTMLGPWLASQLGWQAHQPPDASLCILTKFEIVATFSHPARTAIGARIKAPGLDFIAWSCWLDYRSYLPDYWHAKPDATPAELLACETIHSARAMQTDAIITRLKQLRHLDGPLPLLVGGDWNCPSHLDYGAETQSLHHTLTLPLPSSLAFEHAGFMDTFRAVHPSALKTPGITWSPLYRTAPKTHKPLPMDRIDRLYLRATALKPVSTMTYPQQLESAGIRRAKRQFPSDHAAVLTVLRQDPPEHPPGR